MSNSKPTGYKEKTYKIKITKLEIVSWEVHRTLHSHRLVPTIGTGFRLPRGSQMSVTETENKTHQLYFFPSARYFHSSIRTQWTTPVPDEIVCMHCCFVAHTQIRQGNCQSLKPLKLGRGGGGVSMGMLPWKI